MATQSRLPAESSRWRINAAHNTNKNRNLRTSHDSTKTDMDWKPSDAQGEAGVAITHEIISRLQQMFRRQELNDVGIDAHVELMMIRCLRIHGERIV